MRWGRLLAAALLVLGALACAANSRVADPVTTPAADAAAAGAGEASAPGGALPDQPGARIVSIEARTEGEATMVTIRGDHPLSYTSYDPDDNTLVLELPDAEVGDVPPVVEVGTPHLARIQVAGVPSSSGHGHARVELLGRRAAETRIEPRGSDLVIVLEGTPATAAGSDATAVPAGAAKPASPGAATTTAAPGMPPATEIPAATELTHVEVSEEGAHPMVRLEGDGAFRYNAFELDDPPRLVVDVLGVTNRVKRRRISVDSEPLERIRVSQFSEEPEKVARVVMDLTSSGPFQISTEPAGLVVKFGEEPAAASMAPVDSTMTTTAAASSGQTPEQAPTPGAGTAAPGGPAASAEKTAPTKTPPTAAPASSKLQPVGRDVVLFDRAEPAARQGGASTGGTGTSGLNMTTLPEISYQSRTIAGGRRQYRGEKISVAFRDADLREVMFFFADVMKMNVVLDPDISGKVDIRLNQVPWDQAFQVILKNQGLDAIEEDNVVRIAKTSKLRQEAADLRALKQAQEQAVDPVTFTRTLSYAKVQDAMQVLTQVKTDRGKIVADMRTNTLIISDIPDKQPAYDGLLDAIDTQTPQVVIEARVVEAIRNFSRDLGINWALTTTRSPVTGNPYPYRFPHRVDFVADVNTAPPGFPSAGGIGLMFGNIADTLTLDITLELFETDGKVRILSSPRIATQNNQPATIEQGVQIPVVTTTATEVDVQYVPASLRMIVTPQITAEDTVIMKLKVENNQPSATISVADVPGIVTESVDTQILVRTGTTAVIGGVYKLQESERETGIPGLRRIPFFGWLFKNRRVAKDSSELLVFITPRIVKNI